MRSVKAIFSRDHDMHKLQLTVSAKQVRKPDSSMEIDHHEFQMASLPAFHYDAWRHGFSTANAYL